MLVSALEYYIAAGKLWVPLFLAMPDHCHFLASFQGDEEMTKVMKNWKRFTAKRGGLAWQDGFFEHRLRSHESREEKERYILDNPVRAGLIARSDTWPWRWRPIPSSESTAD